VAAVKDFITEPFKAGFKVTPKWIIVFAVGGGIVLIILVGTIIGIVYCCRACKNKDKRIAVEINNVDQS
jgi:hypothetical protein